MPACVNTSGEMNTCACDFVRDVTVFVERDKKYIMKFVN